MRLLFLIALGLPSWAWAISGSHERIADSLLRVEVGANAAAYNPKISIVVEFRGAVIPVLRELVYEAVSVSLRQRGLRSFKYVGDLRADLERGRLGESSASDKVLVDVSARQIATGIYSLEYSVAYVGFVPKIATPSLVWSNVQHSGGVLSDQIEQTIIEFIQKQIAQASFPNRGSKQSHTSSVHSVVPVAEGLRIRWVDPDGKRNRLFVGVTAGTPAGLNLNLGYWGGNEFPLFAEVSGFYFDTMHRGFQGQAGWIADNHGSFKQVLCLTLSAFAESSSSSVDQIDPLGRVVSTQSTSSYFLSPYFGPSYVGEWNNFRFQLGAGFGAQGSKEPPIRAVFQVGYTFPVGL